MLRLGKPRHPFRANLQKLVLQKFWRIARSGDMIVLRSRLYTSRRSYQMSNLDEVP